MNAFSLSVGQTIFPDVNASKFTYALQLWIKHDQTIYQSIINNTAACHKLGVFTNQQGIKRIQVKSDSTDEDNTSSFDKAASMRGLLQNDVKSEGNSRITAGAAAELYLQDDDDSEEKESPYNSKERRREAHTQVEQKRRDAIKKGYNTLQYLVPSCQQPDSSGYKLSKASVLQKSIDYIEYLLQQKQICEEKRNVMRKDVVALQIMQINYEHMVKAQQISSGQVQAQIPDLKFKMFQYMMDALFVTFSNISVSNFTELSASVFSWLEEYCKPKTLRELIVNELNHFRMNHCT